MTEYVIKGGRALRLGFTTGSCATAAATAATQMLLTQKALDQILITLPEGEQVSFSLEDVIFTKESASCSVMKNAGDDPDVTDGIKIFAECCFVQNTTEQKVVKQHDTTQNIIGLKYGKQKNIGQNKIILKAGIGVGVVTSDGLSVPKGEPAINPIPRKMIMANVQTLCTRYNYAGDMAVTISAPSGETIALKTFNPRLGIEGGISILGTTGVVEPMSEKAIIDTIKLLIDKQKCIDADTILITPGNYGRRFSADVLGIDLDRAVKYSNFLGECLDYLAYKEFKNILLVGHLGKLAKTAGGIMNTHSSIADCRIEIFTAHAACAGADKETAQALMECKTTDSIDMLLRKKNLETPVYASMLEKIMFHLAYRLKAGPKVEVIIFLKEQIVMKSAGANEFIRAFVRVNS